MLKYYLNIFIFYFAFVPQTNPFAQNISRADTIINKLSIQQFKSHLNKLLEDSIIITANVGIVIKSLTKNELIYSLNENKLFIPASNMKLFTTAAGLETLGNNYRFKTDIYIDGDISYSTIEGDLIIRGGGDPTFSSRFYQGNMFKVFDMWIDSLINMGITTIQGNIVGDDNLFDNDSYGTGWSKDYLSYWYAAPSGALSFNDNCIDLTVFYDSNFDSVIIRSKPELPGIKIINEVIPVSPSEAPTNIDIYRKPTENKIKVFGTFSKNNDTLKTYASIYNPTKFTLNTFKSRLQARGIKITGYTVDIDDYHKKLDYDKLQHLFSFYSPKLSEIVKVINKGSQNFYAEQLLKTLGVEIKDFGSIENGIDVCNQWYSKVGLNSQHILMYDGSGLSPLNRVTPNQIVRLLEIMYNSENYPYFLNSLPIAGYDGTLARRMKNSIAESKVRAKTGFIAFARNLSGYLRTIENEYIAFSILINNFNVPTKLIDNLQDKICNLIVSISRKD